MATITSLYLCNRTVYAAVGSPNARGAKITAVCRADLPEGCLINGVITNEAELTAGLREFITQNSLPTHRVGLVLNGSQFVHRIVTLPRLPQKKLYTVLGRELAGGAQAEEPLDDYIVLAQNAQARTQTLLGTRVEKAVIDPYIALAGAVKMKLFCIDTALTGIIRVVGTIPELQEKTFIVLLFDGENLYALLFEQGQYKYSTRSRLFNPRGTPESGAEITQKISGILQFHLTNKSEHAITDVYMGGCVAADLEVCQPGCETLQLQCSVFPESGRITLPGGCRLADALFTAGNLIGR